MKVNGETVAGLLILAAIQGFAMNQTQSGPPEENRGRKREGKKQIPTFVGSDGVVRKVSPTAILEEMKRCLPPGIPIPMEAVWPELPPNLGETSDQEDVGNGQQKTGFDVMPSMVNGVSDENNSGGKKRVMRSNGATRNRSDDFGVPSADGLSVKLELPTRESVICSPTEPNQRKFADVLKEMFSKFDKNSTGFDMKYVDEGAVVDRFKKKFKAPTEDSQDYEDYEGSNQEAGGGRMGPKYRTKLVKSRRLLGKRRDAVKSHDVHPKMSSKSRRSRRGKDNKNLPDYDYDYDESAEEHFSDDESKDRNPINHQADLVSRDELQRQIELNEYLGALTKRLKNAEVQDVDEKRTKTAKYLARMGATDHDKDYNKVLSTVMELNSSLVRLLERAIFSAISHKGSKSEEPNKSYRNDDKIEEGEENSVTSFLLECMEMLMQKRRGLREKRDDDLACSRIKDHGMYKLGSPSLQQLEGAKMKKHRSPMKSTDLSLLKWLLKWYLTVST